MNLSKNYQVNKKKKEKTTIFLGIQNREIKNQVKDINWTKTKRRGKEIGRKKKQ